MQILALKRSLFYTLAMSLSLFTLSDTKAHNFSLQLSAMPKENKARKELSNFWKNEQISRTFRDTVFAAALPQARLVYNFCKDVYKRYQELNLPFDKESCIEFPWIVGGKSEKGSPLVYAVFNDHLKDHAPTTLFLGGVHGDEVPPIYTSFELIKSIASNPHQYKGRIVIAPLINPDGFFMGTRQNAIGIDLNRNFPTLDWWTNAHLLWKTRRKGVPSHFPGYAPNTAEGTRFQIYLIEHYAPDKIITLHSPLNFIDYDGPGDSKTSNNLAPHERQARNIAYFLGKYHPHAQVVDYPFFPGSLGNWAGNERNIPTITVEMPSSSARDALALHKQFAPSLLAVINYPFERFSLAKNAKGLLLLGTTE